MFLLTPLTQSEFLTALCLVIDMVEPEGCFGSFIFLGGQLFLDGLGRRICKDILSERHALQTELRSWAEGWLRAGTGKPQPMGQIWLVFRWPMS